MLLRFSIFFTFLIFCATLISQDYSEGFSYLESGAFDKAEQFFQSYVHEGSKDKTVNLCYGRAVGLNGNAQKAEEIFLSMLDQYPGDYELQLNYAESLMWQSKYQEAAKLYRKLVSRDESSFPATLGYANAQSSLKNYDEAEVLVNQALELIPNNDNALVSKKYILLGKAERLKLSHREEEALDVLNSLSTEYPRDLDILISLSYLLLDEESYGQAKDQIDTLLRYYPKESRVHQLNSNRSLRILKYREALRYSEEALDHHPQRNDALHLALIDQHVNTLIALKEYRRSQTMIDSLALSAPTQDLANRLAINLALAKSNYAEVERSIEQYSGEEYFHQISARSALQNANPWEAEVQLDTIAMIDPESVFYYYFQKELNKSWYNNLKLEYLNLEDNGDNSVHQYTIDYTSHNQNRWQVLLNYRLRLAEQSEVLEAGMQNILAGLRLRLLWDLDIEASVGYALADRNNIAQLSAAIYKLGMKKRFSERHNIAASVLRNYYDYNVNLINNEVYEDRIGVEYFRKFINRFGVYTNGAFSLLSDDNTSTNLFVSVFRDFAELPLIQSGVNLQWLSYTNREMLYFSPSRYTGVEVFAKFDNRYHPAKKWIYSATGAIGIQTIENLSSQSIQRYELEIGYKPNARSWLMAFYRFNNASSATVAGFQARSIGLKGDLRF